MDRMAHLIGERQPFEIFDDVTRFRSGRHRKRFSSSPSSSEILHVSRLTCLRRYYSFRRLALKLGLPGQ